jgi:hypothetical protein
MTIPIPNFCQIVDDEKDDNPIIIRNAAVNIINQTGPFTIRKVFVLQLKVFSRLTRMGNKNKNSNQISFWL